MNTLLSSYPEICFPALPASHSAGLLAILFQLEQSQWWSAERLTQEQFRQIALVVDHARRTVPFYHQKFEAMGLDAHRVATPDGWQDVPLLSRRDIQLSGDALHSRETPPAHGRVSRTMTSGSTNQPVVTLGTQISELFWKVLTLREHMWHRRDFSQSLAAIRYTGDNEALPPKGGRSENWGAATAGTIATGPAFLLNVRSTVEEQAAWLKRTNPGYVLAYPSALRAIAELLETQGRPLSNLRELRTYGEILEPQCRALCDRAFGVKLVDMYSSQEVGYVALQCPEQHYHVMSENLLVEVLDESGRPCRSGEVGKVVVTTLHNFAMPLLRYDIGDYAEVGPPCPCGRGLPVFRRILGRQRNLLVLPDGRRCWPIFDAGERPEDLPPFFQFQVIQRSLKRIDIHVVRHEAYTPREEERVKRYFQQTLGHPFEITLCKVDAISRSRTGKFEDFISEVSRPDPQ
jgi:phenylacetate-CoA ligase